MGNEGLTIGEAREHVGDGLFGGIVGLCTEILVALTVIELQHEEGLAFVHD